VPAASLIGRRTSWIGRNSRYSRVQLVGKIMDSQGYDVWRICVEDLLWEQVDITRPFEFDVPVLFMC
jgi:hypothetical protein